MKEEVQKKRRRSIRLPEHDYSAPGFYFVTICTKDRKDLFGKIREGKIKFSELGKIADRFWKNIPEHFPDVHLWEYVIMPNHVHGIIEIFDRMNQKNVKVQYNVGVQHVEPLRRSGFQKIISKSLSVIVRNFKSAVTKYAHENEMTKNPIWQRNFYDRIIRDEDELNQIRDYIVSNPVQWAYDRKNFLPLR